MDFYDYKTRPVEGSNIFDTSKTGMSFYDDLIPGDPENEYMEKEKNLKGAFEQMTPLEYFYACAQIFNSDVDRQIAQTEYDKKTIEHLISVIKEHKVCFPVTFLNFAEKTQEGRHRMYVAAQLFGWNKKFPVLIINWADPEREKRQQQQAIYNEIEKKVKGCVKEALQYKFNNIDEFIEELNYQFDNLKDDLKNAYSKETVYDIEQGDNYIFIHLKDKDNYRAWNDMTHWDVDIDIDDIQIRETPEEFDIEWDDIPEEEIEQELSKYRLG